MAEFIVFNKNILSWAMRRANVSIEQFGDLQSSVDSWLNGTKKPTINQTRELSKKLGVPFGYFCLSAPPKDNLNLPDFRTVGGHLVKNISLGLRKTIQHAKECQEFLSEFFEENDYPTFRYKNALTLEMDAAEGARVLRRILGVRKIVSNPADNYRDLCSRIERAGVLVQKNRMVLNSSREQLNPKEFRGFALFDDYAPLIFINENDFNKAQIFSLIHEFCHLLLGVTGLSGEPLGSEQNRNKIEKFCDKVAVEYLVPKAEFETEWHLLRQSKEDLEATIKEAAKKFGVSFWLALRRAQELFLINRDFFNRQMANLLNAASHKKTTGHPNYTVVQTARMGKVLIDAAVMAAHAGTISYNEAERLTLLSQKGLVQRARELRL